jgi:hypothetical protein
VTGPHASGGPHLDPRAPRGDGVHGPVVLTGADLTIDDVEAVARRGATAALDVHARARMDEARAVIEALVAEVPWSMASPPASATWRRRSSKRHSANCGSTC